jgi:hypothetical protein
MKGPRGGEYMVSPGGKKVYDRSKWPKEQKPQQDAKAGWKLTNTVTDTIVTPRGQFEVMFSVFTRGNLRLKVDDGASGPQVGKILKALNETLAKAPEELLKHANVFAIHRQIRPPGVPGGFKVWALNTSSHEIHINASADIIEPMWDEVIMHEMGHQMIRSMTFGTLNPTHSPTLPILKDYIKAFKADAKHNRQDDLMDQEAYVTDYAGSPGAQYEWEPSRIAGMGVLAEDIADTIGYMATRTERFGGPKMFKTFYPNRVRWYEKWVLKGEKWRGP